MNVKKPYKVTGYQKAVCLSHQAHGHFSYAHCWRKKYLKRHYSPMNQKPET